jgi:hypothetical protein
VLGHLGVPILAGSSSKIVTMWKPWSAKIDDPAMAWPSRPAPTSAMLCWPEVRRIPRISAISASML